MWDDRSERSVLGAVMLDDRCIERLTIPAHAFFKEPHRIIWQAMNVLNAEGQPIDLVTLSHYLKENGTLENVGGAHYMAGLASETPGTVNVEYYANLVERNFRKRHADDRAREAMEATARYRQALRAGHNDEEIQARTDRWESDLLTCSAAAVEPFRADTYDHRGHAWLGAAVERLKDGYQRAADDPHGACSTISSMFDGVDAILELPGDNLTVVGARPGMGKSSLAVNWMRLYAEAGEMPYLFVLEDATREQLFRLIAQMSGIQAPFVRKLLERRADHPDAARDLDTVLGWMENLPPNFRMGFDDTPSVTIETIRMKAKQRAREGATMFLIDHALKVRPSAGRGDRRLEVSHVVSQSCALAMELGKPVILFTQLKRLEKDRRPTYGDLKETGNFEEDARAIILLYREEYALAQKRREKRIDYPHPVEMIVPKANHWAVGTGYAIFEPTKTLMRDPSQRELQWIEESRANCVPYRKIVEKHRSIDHPRRRY
jgi:replicative DNA helicase